MRRPLALCLALLAAPALAADHAHEHEHAHAGHADTAPHEHGVASIRLALEDKQLELLIELPAMDALGHEQRATTPEERAALMRFQRELLQSAGVVSIAPGCRQLSGEAAADGGEGEHRDVQLVYRLECPEAPRQLDFRALFARFPSLQQGRLEALGASGGESAELSPASPVFSWQAP